MGNPVPGLGIVSVAGPAFVQDAGRPGRMDEGIPPGGPLVPELFAIANRAVGNPASAAAIEALGPLRVTARGGDVVLSVDGRPVRVTDGEILAIPAPAPLVVRYVGVRGGLDVPVVLGGRGTLPSCGLGGHEGRALQSGDVLPVATGPVTDPRLRAAPVWEADAPIRVIPGPDLDRFAPGAIATLLGAAYRVSPVGDRVGMRLEGPVPPRLAGDVALSGPMVRGAIEVPAADGLLVLGPDHPTTGGYPVVATILRADLGALAARPPGSRVRFRLA
jgi:biotin-dependent carboxylase-like uncharacterized protein